MKRLLAALTMTVLAAPTSAAEALKPADERYSDEKVTEAPDFQKHVLPLMGRLGCNGRACHGSFQGQGGFQLSLFGYDFKADHDALVEVKDKGKEARVDLKDPESSLVLLKPTLDAPHKGGQRMEFDSWQYRLFLRWIEHGATMPEKQNTFAELEVIPNEIVFKKAGEQVNLRVIAHWADGDVEDVTCLTRFRTNDESIAEVSEEGIVTAKGKGDTHVVAFYDNGVAVCQSMLPVSDRVGEDYPKVPTPTKIDELVLQKLRKMGLVPSGLSTDAEFLRRVSLDMTGTLPSANEVKAFVKDTSRDKRAGKIDELLQRPGYTAWWTTKLCDWTGNNERALNLQVVRNGEPARHWYSWIEKRVRDNVPYDELIAGIVLATSREPGQSYDDYCKQESAYYRKNDPADYAERKTMPYYWARRTVNNAENRALNFSYSFLGVRLECAQCHKHPFDQWTQQDFKQFSQFFANVNYRYDGDANQRQREMLKELGVADIKDNGKRRNMLRKLVEDGTSVPWREVYVSSPRSGNRRGRRNRNRRNANARAITPKLLGGEQILNNEYPDPREALMDWMREEGNPYFGRAFVNRVWANYFNVGIIDPPDDQNLANPPSNKALLDYLTAGFVQSGFDMKWLHREIANSRTYQLSWKPNETNELDERNFSRAVLRRLPAEVAYDAFLQATANDESVEAYREVRTNRAISMAAMSYRGRGGNNRYAMQVFGKPERTTTCDCERSNEPTLLQSIYLRNDQETLTAIDRRDGWLAQLAKDLGEPMSGDSRSRQANRNRRPQRSKAEWEKLIAGAERRIKALRKQDKDRESAQARRRLDGLRKQMQADLARRRRGPASESRAAANAGKPNVNQVIEQAYLRTLNRVPKDAEIERAKEHFKDSQTTVSGARDLLWALVNTKEFIVNH